jgi:glycosyltransferase involved in cell wall biosynthesis
MTDLSALKGLVPSLAQTPSIVYFHENQFGYPGSGKEFKSVEPKILNFYTALAADRVLFNSEYNSQTFFKGLEDLLKKMPDLVPGGMVEAIKNKAKVLPVPISLSRIHHDRPDGCFNIVWNHRWEYDKNPKLLLESMQRLREVSNEFTLHVVGKSFRTVPDEFELIKAKLSGNLGKWGYMESKSDYLNLLNKADVVLSTAIHDFQGVAVLEGVSAGAVPVVPDRLAYRELFEEQYRYSDDEAEGIANKILMLMDQKKISELNSPDISHLSWERLIPEYDKVFQSVASLNR